MVFIQENAFIYAVCETAAILSPFWYVKFDHRNVWFPWSFRRLMLIMGIPILAIRFPYNETTHRYQTKLTLSFPFHYNDVIMSTMASQITSLTIVYSTVYSDTDERKHQSSASLACGGNSPETGEFPAQMASKWFHLMTSSCFIPGPLRCERLGQVPVRSYVQVAGSPCEQDSGHQTEASVLHRCTGYRRLRDLRGEIFYLI